MMSVNKIAALLGKIMVLSSVGIASAHAGETSKYDSLYDDCVKEAGTMNNTVVMGCSETVSEAVKRDMNRLYDVIYARIAEQSKEDAQKFEFSQKSWLKYRNNHCELMGSYVGSPMYAYCPMQLNKARVAELTEMAGE